MMIDRIIATLLGLVQGFTVLPATGWAILEVYKFRNQSQSLLKQSGISIAAVLSGNLALFLILVAPIYNPRDCLSGFSVYAFLVQ